jgi:pimeloyl-ACP methyl ester carboxylesterase
MTMQSHYRKFLIGISLFLFMLILPYAIPIGEARVTPVETLMEPNGAFFSWQNTRIYYEDHGDPDATALLFIHGLFGSTKSWRYNIDALVEAGYRVITYDRTGFGISDKPETFDYSVINQADQAIALLDSLGIEQAVIIGHSAGGNVAARIAVRYPEIVQKLVLVDAAVLAGGPPSFVAGFMSFPPIWRWGQIGIRAYFTRDRLENTIQGFYLNPDQFIEADYDTYWRAFETANWEVGLLGLTRDGGSNLLTDADLAQISPETLLLWGAQDLTTPLEQAERLHTLIPASNLVIIPDSAHQPFEENPVEFHAALLKFLGQPAASSS